MKKRICAIVLLTALLASSLAVAGSATYEQTVAQWTSYKDVAAWMERHFSYDTRKLKLSRGWEAGTPQETLQQESGICQDGAVFAKDALNRIDPGYNARLVYVQNRLGKPHHWVTGFTLDGKLYIIDYATGGSWRVMQGVHGPYDSLKGYEEFLRSLHLADFQVEFAQFRRNNAKGDEKAESQP